MKGEDGISVMMGNSPKVLLEHGVLGKWGGRKNYRLQINTVLHPGWTEFC